MKKLIALMILTGAVATSLTYSTYNVKKPTPNVELQQVVKASPLRLAGSDDVVMAITPDHPEYKSDFYKVRSVSDQYITGIHSITGELLTIKVNGIHHPILVSAGDEILVITNPEDKSVVEVLPTSVD